MRRGAYSYLTKPFEPGDLLLQIERALENRKLTSEIKRLKGLLHEQFDFANIIARSAKMRSVLDVVMRIARLDSTVHIHGESGTGKELIAKAIHLASDRKDKPFIALNCAACWRASFSATRKGLSPVRLKAPGDFLLKRTAAHFFSTRSATCRFRLSRNCCVSCKSGNFIRLAARSPPKSMCES
jgi:DNA-binding response OmpR family regulator